MVTIGVVTSVIDTLCSFRPPHAAMMIILFVELLLEDWNKLIDLISLMMNRATGKELLKEDGTQDESAIDRSVSFGNLAADFTNISEMYSADLNIWSKRTILDSILSEDVCIMPCKGINYISIYEDISKEPMLQVEFTEAGVCHGFALWIDWVMDSTNNIVMSTGPGGLINTSGYNIDEATPIMEWGRKGQNKKLSPAGALTFTRSSMAPARTVGWRDPGQDSLQRVIIFGDMGKIIMANIIPPDHVDDVPVVEPNQPDDVPVILELVLVDKDEDPEEEEFEEEEEPQEEE
ncbi:nucleotide pyrophosphatase/phosphodiesterase-like protein [Tanacetum coccineum]